MLCYFEAGGGQKQKLQICFWPRQHIGPQDFVGPENMYGGTVNNGPMSCFLMSLGFACAKWMVA